MFRETALIKVASINKSHLKQISFVPYSGKEYREIFDAIGKEEIKVRYWINGSAIGMDSFDRLWLIEGPSVGQFRMIIPPNPAYDQFKNLAQLFVG